MPGSKKWAGVKLFATNRREGKRGIAVEKIIILHHHEGNLTASHYLAFWPYSLCLLYQSFSQSVESAKFTSICIGSSRSRRLVFSCLHLIHRLHRNSQPQETQAQQRPPQASCCQLRQQWDLHNFRFQ
eukprot:GHVT01048215.1.p1 GENE.GHVT01048215.1~~GHVT01048215.1.p1  ORF type:complete len:128 (-),score=5.02 GHVT01048215.1:946-1329(-)